MSVGARAAQASRGSIAGIQDGTGWPLPVPGACTHGFLTFTRKVCSARLPAKSVASMLIAYSPSGKSGTPSVLRAPVRQQVAVHGVGRLGRFVA